MRQTSNLGIYATLEIRTRSEGSSGHSPGSPLNLQSLSFLNPGAPSLALWAHDSMC